MPKGTITAAEMGRRGGLRTAETHGHEFYTSIGTMAGRTTADRRAKFIRFSEMAIKAMLNEPDYPGRQEAIEFFSAERARLIKKYGSA